MQPDCSSLSGRYQGAAAESDKIRVSQTGTWHNRGAVAEVDALGEQQLKWMQLGPEVGFCHTSARAESCPVLDW